jgi:hypothetical protein
MYARKPRRSNPEVKRGGSSGFPEGLNTLAHPSTLKDTELSELINGTYSQYGTISKRKGSTIIGNQASGASEINQLVATYNIAGASRLIRISDNGKPEVYNFGTQTWSYLTATAPSGYTGSNPTFTDGTPIFDVTTTTWIVQTGNRLYFCNAVNEMVWLEDDGWHIYTALTDPTTLPTVAKTGTGTGSTQWFYQYCWRNEAGASLASTPPDTGTHSSGTGWIGSMPLTLDDTTYLTITLPAAPAGATYTDIFRSNLQGQAFYVETISAKETTYVDKGQTASDTFYGVPSENTTAGYHFKLLEVYRGSLVGVTVEEGNETLVWSGALDKYGSFALSDGAGFFPYRKGEGTTINAIKTHVASNEDSLFVFKDNCFGRFQYISASDSIYSGEGRIQDVNISIGSISPFSPHVAGNNLRFWSGDGASSVGNEANYGNILRYSVMSLRADSVVQRINPANMHKICGIFHKSLSLYGIPTGLTGTGNNAVLVYDERYNSWSYWTGIYANLFCKYIDPTTKEEKLFYASNYSADVLEMFKGNTDYKSSTSSGTTITLSISTKQYDLKLPDQFKKFNKAVLVFGTLTGNNTSVGVIKATKDGVESDARLMITQESTLSGFGNDEWGDQEFGMMSEEDAGSTVNIRYIDLRQKDMFWVKLNIQNNGVSDELSLIGVYLYYSLSSRPLTFNMKLRTIAS